MLCSFIYVNGGVFTSKTPVGVNRVDTHKNVQDAASTNKNVEHSRWTKKTQTHLNILAKTV